MSNFIYDNLPLFIEDNYFEKLDSIVSKKAIKNKIESNYNTLLSPIGGYISDFIYRDPLSLGTKALGELQNMGNNIHYSIVDNYIFSQDKKTIICYISPNLKIKIGRQSCMERECQ